MKLHITRKGEIELKRLGFDILTSLEKILKYVPILDTSKIDRIIITDTSKTTYAGGVYIPKGDNQPAQIELFLIKLFSHVTSEKSFKLMLPIQEIGLAQAIYHEIGHHIRLTRSHRIGKIKSENFANSYATNLLDKYILDNTKSIESCYDNLMKVADSEELDTNVINSMRRGWKRHHKEAVERCKKTNDTP